MGCCCVKLKNEERTELGIPRGNTHVEYLLPPIDSNDVNKLCLVIDLDETLVHSSFKPICNPDFIVPVEIDGRIHQVHVLKRPFVDEFLQKMGQLYECVLFTASLAKYADPVANLLDRWGVFKTRLFRESCVYYRGNYIKDLDKLGRDLNKVIIVDNSPASYIFHPHNAVPVASWFDDMSDTELRDLIPFFDKLSKMDDVYTVLKNANHSADLSATGATPAPTTTSINSIADPSNTTDSDKVTESNTAKNTTFLTNTNNRCISQASWLCDAPSSSAYNRCVIDSNNPITSVSPFNSSIQNGAAWP